MISLTLTLLFIGLFVITVGYYFYEIICDILTWSKTELILFFGGLTTLTVVLYVAFVIFHVGQ
jgi:hypothetical protein